MKVSGREPEAGGTPASTGRKAHAAVQSSRPGYTSEGLPSAQSMREAHQAWADTQDITTSCFFCAWTFVGPAGEGREKALAHRQKKHPEACIRKARRRGSRISKRKNRTPGEEAQIKLDTEEANRVRAEREQGEMLAKIERGRERDRAAALALDGAL